MPEKHPLKAKIYESARTYSGVARMVKKDTDGRPYCVGHFNQMLNGVRPLPADAVKQICEILLLDPEEYLNDAKK
jgi:hypothetical protein